MVRDQKKFGNRWRKGCSVKGRRPGTISCSAEIVFFSSRHFGLLRSRRHATAGAAFVGLGRFKPPKL